MFIERDFLASMTKHAGLEALMLWGPRQVGKTTLLDRLPLASRAFLDDLALRQRAQGDPALFLDGLDLPCLVDEAQYAPNVFSEIKLRIDRDRRKCLAANDTKRTTQYYLTGSNRFLLDKTVKESLAGRSHLYTLHGLSVKEILQYRKDYPVKALIIKGGLPEIYVNECLSLTHYINDYILSFIEKDIAYSAGVQKTSEFQTLLRMLAARSGQFLNINEIASAAGIDNKTIKAWISLLQRNTIIELVQPHHSNLSKRLVKMPKLYFYDTGVCSRLQSHTDANQLWNSSQIGSLFETLVFSEIMKTKDNFLQDWQVHCWRTKDRAEIDFVVINGNQTLLIEAKLAIHGAKPIELDREAKKVFSKPFQKIVVTAGGKQTNLGQDTIAVPIQEFGTFVNKHFAN